MSKPKVFVARLIPEAGLDMVLAETDAEVWQEQLPPSREVILEKVADKDGLLSLLTDKVDGEVISKDGRFVFDGWPG